MEVNPEKQGLKPPSDYGTGLIKAYEGNLLVEVNPEKQGLKRRSYGQLPKLLNILGRPSCGSESRKTRIETKAHPNHRPFLRIDDLWK